MKADIYNKEGKKAGSIELPEAIFGVAWNDALMHQVVTSMEDNARTNVAHTKDRGEVRGGGKKPWRQKGTGRARHGSTRSPIWVGGGVAHGPRNTKVFARVLPKGMRNKALAMALSRKFKEGEVIFVESLELKGPKTREAKQALLNLASVKGFERLATKRRNVALVAVPEKSESLEKSFRNLSHTETVRVSNLNPVLLLRHSFLIVESPKESLALIEHRLAKKVKVEESK